MSMLAEPRSRQKWSQDPRNTNWSNDKTKFGYQLLTKMGWSEGKGLGQNLSGTTNHIKVNKRRSNAGIGLKKSHEDDWIGHQDDFNALLCSLNQNSDSSATGKITSLENRVKLSKKKILYKRFIKSKDLSNASSHDLACIFGQRGNSVSAPTKENDNDDNDSDSDSDVSGTECPIIGVNSISDDMSIKTVETGVSIADYFAKKMASLKQKQTAADENIVLSKTSDDDTKTDLTEKKKKKKKKVLENDDTEEVVDECINKDDVSSTNHIEETKLTEKKKKKKKKTLKSDDTEEIVVECTIKDDESILIHKEDTKSTEKKKKKKKKTQFLDTENEDDEKSKKRKMEEDDTLTEDVVLKKKKKKKKKKHDIDE